MGLLRKTKKDCCPKSKEKTKIKKKQEIVYEFTF